MKVVLGHFMAKTGHQAIFGHFRQFFAIFIIFPTNSKNHRLHSTRKISSAPTAKKLSTTDQL